MPTSEQKRGQLSLAAQIVRAVCELDETADPHHCDTICVTVQDLEAVIENRLEAHNALTAAEGVKPRVKPLEWEPGIVDWARPMPGMKYVACSSEGNKWAWWLEGEEPTTRERCGNEQLAKAAAQADYEARILSALIPTGGE